MNAVTISRGPPRTQTILGQTGHTYDGVVTIQAVLFDYSGVMTANFAIATENTPYDPDLLIAEMISVVTNERPHAFHDLERGKISIAEFIGEIEQSVPGAGALFDPASEFNVMANLPLLDERVALVRRLATSGLGVGLLTNNVAEWEPLWRPGLPEDLFEVIIDSSAVGHRKPDPEIYQLGLEALGGLDPASVLFVDDFEWNVEGAIAAGLRGLHCASDMDLGAAIDSIVTAG